MGIFTFLQKETGDENVAMATALRVSFCFSFSAHFKNTASIFPEISFIQYFPLLVANNMTSSLI